MAIERISAGRYRDTETGRTGSKSELMKKSADKSKGKGKDKSKTSTETKEESVAKATDLTKSQEVLDKLLAPGGAASEYGKQLGNIYADGSLGRLSTERTAEESEALARLKLLADNAGVRSQDIVEIMSRMKGGLEGYNSQELQGQREAMGQEVNRNLSSALTEQRRMQGISRTRGAASSAQAANLQRSAMQDKGNIERDIFLRNADEKDRRLQNFGQYTRQVEGDESGRKKEFEGMYQNSVSNLNNIKTQKDVYNSGQQAAEKAGQVAGNLGGTGAYLSSLFGLKSAESAAGNTFDANAFLQAQQKRADEMNKMYGIK